MIQNIPIKDLKLLEKNPRRITKQKMEKLCDSIKEDPEFLNERPVLVNLVEGEYHVYAGNQRIRAAKKLGWKEIPCSVVEGLEESVLRKRVLKDNKTFGEFDFDLLANDYELDELFDAGFNDKELHLDDFLEKCERVESIKEKEEQDESAVPKKHTCPNCGWEF